MIEGVEASARDVQPGPDPSGAKPPALNPQRLAQWVPLALIVLAVWLAAQIILVPLTQRSPPGMAVRINPGSPVALSRAAEAEFVDGRYDNALALSREALRKSPFSVQALRVAGMATDKLGRPADANEMLTLAGNWSLRDDPSHAWLVIYRLRQGDLPGAFAHADTLMRRGRQQPVFFSLLSTAAREEPRSIGLIAELLAAQPPWQSGFFNSLYETPEGAHLAANLVIQLEARGKPVDDQELSRLYSWIAQHTELSNLERVRRAIGRPKRLGTGLLDDGQFDQTDLIAPLGWNLERAAGLQVEITGASSTDPNRALRVSYSGLGQKVIAYQYVVVPPGRLKLTGRVRQEQPSAAGAFVWQAVCLYGGNSPAAGQMTVHEADSRDWQRFEALVDIPASGCSGIVLRLMTQPTTNRLTATIWLDDLDLAPAG